MTGVQTCALPIWNLNIAPMSNGQKSFDNSTNIKKDSKGEFYAKKYMFSIENLAWKTSTKSGYTVNDFEIILTDQKVNNVSSINSLTQDGNKIIWNIVSSATNYVIEVKQSGTNSIAPILVASPAVSSTTTTVDYTFSGLSGSYDITVTPYNNLGIAGTAKTASFAF